MQKRILIIITLFLCLVEIKSQTITDLTSTMAEEVFKQLKKNPIPVESKVAVCFFIGEQGSYDDIQSKLGIEIANEFAITLKREFQNKKRLENIEIILNDNVGKVLNAEMKGSFIPPDNTKDEEAFWKQLKNNERPDYFISGKYEIVGDFNALRLKNVRLERNKFNTDFKDQGYRPPIFSNVDIPIKSQREIEKLKIWHSPIKNTPEIYSNFIRLQSLSSDLNIHIIKGSNNDILASNEPLLLNTDYQFQVILEEDAYIYGFYYESDDLLGLHMFMLYPITKNENNLCKAGKINLPRIADKEFMFTPSPPTSGQVVIKIVASTKKLALNFTETPNGYIYLNEAQCKQFYNQLTKLNTSDYQIVTLVKNLDE